MSKRIPTRQTLPSGVVVDVAKIMLEDLMNIGDESESKKNEEIESFMGRCVFVEDPAGFYARSEMEPGSKISVKDLVPGDNVALLLLQRIVSVGYEFDFDFFCIDDKCRKKTKKRNKWTFDLRRFFLPFLPEGWEDFKEDTEWSDPDTGMVFVYHNGQPAIVWEKKFGLTPILIDDDRIYFQAFSEEAKSVFSNGGTHEFMDGEGKKILFRESTVGEIRKLKSLKDIDVILSNIREIEGIEAKGAMRRKVHEQYIRKNWDLADFDEFTARTSELTGGIDPTPETECAYCGLLQDVEFKFDSPAFFSPRTARKKFGKR